MLLRAGSGLIPRMEPHRQGGRVLVVSASVGAGHNQAARAVVERLREAAPGLEVEHVDALNFAGRCFRAWYAGGYALMVSRLPWLYGLGFRMTDHPDGPRRSLAERRRLWTERLAMRRMSEHILAGRYDLILHTHFLVAPMVARSISDFQRRSPLMRSVSTLAEYFVSMILLLIDVLRSVISHRSTAVGASSLARLATAAKLAPNAGRLM